MKNIFIFVGKIPFLILNIRYQLVYKNVKHYTYTDPHTTTTIIQMTEQKQNGKTKAAGNRGKLN